MKQVILVNSPRFELISYGSGIGYLLTNREIHKEVHVAGDDADAFREEWEEHERMFPLKSTDAVMAWMWDLYEAVAVNL